jgi:transcriptional regulator with XRE-family HTH domain
MSENKRIKNVIFYLISQDTIESQEDFANRMGYNPSSVSQIVSGKKPLSEKFANKVADTFKNINSNYLFGNGEMLKNGISEEKNTNLNTNLNINLSEKNVQLVQKSEQRKLIPFYDINVEAGTVSVSNMDAVSEPDEWIDAGDWFLDADSAMRVHGDSMFPLYKSGSIVVMREIHDKKLIVYGRDYVIQTSEYKVIKRLQKSDVPHCWLACSVNDETWEKGDLAGKLIHEPFDIDIDSVTKLFMVLGCVSRNESSRIVYTKNRRQ